MHDSLPYITLLFLNAGFSPPAHVNYARMMVEVIKRGPVEAYTRPAFTTERLGMKTKDGERGLTWSINTLAPYLLVSGFVCCVFSCFWVWSQFHVRARDEDEHGLMT